MVNLAVLTGLFARYYRIFGVPILGTLVILLICFEVFGLTDNHQFRYKQADIQRPTVETAFKSWLAARKDAAAYRNAGKPYPVYVVAAEGGGLYAAYQTAKFLARMQDLCPNFAQHVFAVSSVSGGSLGAAVFAGLTRSLAANDDAKPCLDKLADRGNFETRADAILSRDLLAPVVWGGLFPDFLQRFIPWPLPAFDRARALEYAFEESWRYGADQGEQSAQRTPVRSVRSRSLVVPDRADAGARLQREQHRDGHADGAEPARLHLHRAAVDQLAPRCSISSPPASIPWTCR